MKIKEIVNALEIFAPLPLQDGFDNAGLQIGLTDAEATGALLCLDVTEAVVDEAIALGYNLIVSHHPLIFKGYKSITGRDYVERCILKAIKNDIVIFSMHTNLDNAPQGVNFKIAEKIGLKNVRILEPKENQLLKLVTFVPQAQADEVRNTLFEAGCGCIGNYDSCSYNLEGKGTFRAQPGTHPFCGEIGQLHEEHEVRIETVLPAFLKGKVQKAFLVHDHCHHIRRCGTMGKKRCRCFCLYDHCFEQIGSKIITRIKKLFEVGCVKHSRMTGRLIQTVALCGGAGAFLLPKAVRAHADVFLTGEVKYHDYFSYENDILIAEIGHYESEQYTKDLLYSIIREKFPTLDAQLTRVNTNPIKYL